MKVEDQILIFATPQRDWSCRVQAVQGTFVKCERTAGDQRELWINLAAASGFRR